MRNIISDAVARINPRPISTRIFPSGPKTCEIMPGYLSSNDFGTLPRTPGDSYRGILYADMVAVQSNDRSARALRECLPEAVKILLRKVVENGGRTIDIDGPAILAQFKDTDQALHCAINVQLAARQWNADIPRDRQFQFRIGIVSCGATADQQQLREISACLASQLENLASVGGICVTDSMRAGLDDHPSLNCVDAGRRFVRDRYQPVETFWIEIDTEQFVSGSLTGAVKVTA